MLKNVQLFIPRCPMEKDKASEVEQDQTRGRMLKETPDIGLEAFRVIEYLCTRLPQQVEHSIIVYRNSSDHEDLFPAHEQHSSLDLLTRLISRPSPNRPKFKDTLTMALFTFEASKTAVITGGVSGIGLAVAQKCLDHGMKIVIADQDSSKLIETKQNLGSALANLEMDVGRAEDWIRL
ncbi:oxidoreductase YkvO 1 [Verticillium dahliae]